MPRLLASQIKSLELLSHLVSYSDFLIAVTADAGAGKTLIANMLAAHRESPEETLVLTVNVTTGISSILSAIANHWDMPSIYDDSIASRKIIAEESLSRKASGTDLLVVLDQAEQLDEETLNELATFALSVRDSVSFVLFGSTGFAELIRQSPAQLPVHNHSLQALDQEEIQDLLADAHGQEFVSRLSSKVIQEIMASSRGLPGAVLTVAEQYMEGNESPGTDSLTKLMPLANIFAVAVIATALIVLMLYNRGEDEAGVELNETELTSSTEEEKTPLLDKEGAKTNEDDKSDIATVELEVPEIASLPLNPDPSNLGDKPVPESLNRDETSQKQYNGAGYALKSEENISDVMQSEQSTTQSQSDFVGKKQEQVKEPASVKLDEATLLNSKGYIVQLLGSYSLDGALAFKKKWQDRVSGDLYLYRTQLNNKDWYVVVYGIYSTGDQASDAKNKLPREILSSSPWVKSLDLVHEAID